MDVYEVTVKFTSSTPDLTVMVRAKTSIDATIKALETVTESGIYAVNVAERYNTVIL